MAAVLNMQRFDVLHIKAAVGVLGPPLIPYTHTCHTY